MTDEYRLAFWLVVALALIVAGVWAAWRFFMGSGRKASVAPPQPRAAELLHIERDAASGQILIWLKGRRVEHIADIADEGTRAPLALLMSSLAAEEPVPAQLAQPPPAPVPPPASAPAAQPPSLPEDELNRPFFVRVRESLAKPQNYARNPAGPAAKRGAAQRDANAPDQSNWVFAQIDAVLQQKLRAQPEVPEMEITGEGGELRIRVGAETYTQVDAVPDEHIRQLIRSAVAEWESS